MNSIIPLIGRLARYAGVLALAGAVGLWAPAATAAPSGEGSALKNVAAGQKLIRIRDAGDGAPGEEGLQIDIRTARSTYRQGQAIRFQVRGNHDFFLYLINIDPRSGRAVAILPNRLQTGDSIKYPGDGQWYSVPNERLEFYGDRPGLERIIMIASERYLEVDSLLRKSRSKAAGDFYAMEAPLDALDEAIGASYGEKTIRIRDSGDRGSQGQGGNRLPRGLVIKEWNLRIR
ncbi:MAG: hypothetical protein A2286_11990 [Gammaproteobacteria bacterium RIFOXYA12_FULL_61_12]|nr:MAG: hypothetical protein A2286_11990 [Gammaproteobacteria bacterium RIFOXYA12_FULL_61_12]OGT91103.1 MAG: hypothetical protein A2514_09360 [Gammaproteobacteria bacterium RIFOXYD12_FULL_61_37]